MAVGSVLTTCGTWYLQRLSVPIVDAFLEDLKDAIREAKLNPSGKGTMVTLYG